MSAENVAVVRRLVDLWYRPEASDELAEVLTDDYVHHAPRGDLNAAELAEQLRLISAAFAGITYEIDHVVAEADRVAVFVTVRATHAGNFFGVAATGQEVVMSGATFCRLAHGRVAEDWDAWNLLGTYFQLSAG